MSPRSLHQVALVVAAATLGLPSLAVAQTPSPPSAGPMKVESLHSGFYGGADVKVTDFNHHTAELIGGEGGWMMDESFFVGGAFYGLVNGGSNDELYYGGLVMKWMVPVSSRVTIGAKALIGGGDATVSQSTVLPYAGVDIDPRTIGNNPRQIQSAINNAVALRPVTYRYDESFFVFEPEATASVRVAGRVHLTGGISYRLTSSYYYYGYYTDSHLGGLTGTIGFRVF